MDRLLSVCYDDQGNYVELTIDFDSKMSQTASGEGTGGGQSVTLSASMSGLGSVTVTLRRNGNTLISRTGNYSISGSGETIVTNCPTYPSAECNSHSGSGSRSADFGPFDFSFDDEAVGASAYDHVLAGFGAQYAHFGEAVEALAASSPTIEPVQFVLGNYWPQGPGGGNVPLYFRGLYTPAREFGCFTPCLFASNRIAGIIANRYIMNDGTGETGRVESVDFQAGDVASGGDGSTQGVSEIRSRDNPVSDIRDALRLGHPFFFYGTPAIWCAADGSWATAAWLEDEQRYEHLNWV
ncbi:MAG: immunoglobulin domain-containing protein [Gammaproteobacteria bacterium]|nr:immunoglobulin domain-containing protein [Gammaproteobacteria bacterium]